MIGLCGIITRQSCVTTQFEVATTLEDEAVRERQLKEKRDKSKLDYYENHEKNLAKSRKYLAPNKHKILDYAKKNVENNIVPQINKKVSDYSKNYHTSHREERLEAFKNNYIANREERLEGFKDNYASNLEQREKDMNKYYA
uniref:Uncharacterized protein n=1 Tax=Amphimedon queenslandica TaxID=400682 RepID=A0A1X7TXI1_AMPQE